MAIRKGNTLLSGAWIGALFGFVSVALMFIISTRYPSGLEFFELKVFDLRTSNIKPPTGAVAIAAIDDKSIEEIGRWPWPRSTMAKMVAAMKNYGVAVIGIDLLFSEQDDQDVQRRKFADRLRVEGMSDRAIEATLGASNDAAFALALKDQGSTYLAYAFESHRLSGHLNEPMLHGFTTTIHKPGPMEFSMVRTVGGVAPELLSAEAYLPPIDLVNSAAKGSGYVDVDHSTDGVTRSELGVIHFEGHYCVPLYLALVSAYRHQAPLYLTMSKDGVSSLELGDQNIPVDELGRMLLNFRGPTGTIPHYSVSDIINHRIPPLALAGKIVLVGVTGRGLGDRKVTPVDGDMPGVEVHANAVDNVIRGDFLRRSKVTDFEEKVFALILGIAVSLIVAYLPGAWSVASSGSLGLGYVLYTVMRLHVSGVLLPIVFPILVMVVAYSVVVGYRYLTEGREKRRLRHAFEHYMNPDVIASVVDDPEGLKLGGERRHLSILFADIVGFTTRAERAESPEALIAELNTYFTRMLDQIMKSGGVVDKLIGDAIMAFWGAPADVEHPARLAMDTALGMLSELKKLKQEDKRFADFDIGVGIATGEPVVGNLGGESRFDYSVIGDCVNFASRLEGLTRKFGVHMLVSKNTYDEAVAAGGSYIVREVGLVRVKGKHEKLPIVEVVGQANDGIDPAFYQRFADIRELIAGGEDQKAVDELHRMEELKPNDHLIEMYLEHLTAHLANGNAEPLREMVFEFESK